MLTPVGTKRKFVDSQQFKCDYETCNASFTNPETNEIYCLYTEQDTMYIMSDEARYKWKHQMRSRKNDKVDSMSKCQLPRKECFSVTFREVGKK